VTDLLEETIAAHGGRQRWAQLSSITTHARWSGTFWALKQQPGLFSGIDMTAELHTQRVSITPFVHDRWRGVFERDGVRIENAGGEIEEERGNPRASFTGHEVRTPWGHLHALYFGGYTMWTYLTVPFVFHEPGFTVTEGEPWTEHGQTWRRLQVTFPETIATHNAEQVFYVDTDGLIKRHDYTAEVVGGGLVSHYLHGHKEFDGIVFPTLRQVFPRQPDNQAATELMFIQIEFDRYTLS
jgi:hypothetical protein